MWHCTQAVHAECRRQAVCVCAYRAILVWAGLALGYRGQRPLELFFRSATIESAAGHAFDLCMCEHYVT